MDSYTFGDRLDVVVRARARQSPDAIAVRQGDVAITYCQLVDQATVVADRLREAGVGHGGYVPVIMDRSPELITIILAVMQAGSAYVCLDPGWPGGRIRDALDRCGSHAIIDTRDPTTAASDRDAIVISVPDLLGPGSPTAEMAPTGQGADPACVFFTSGSTGRPKGAIVPHRGIVRAVVGNPNVPAGGHTIFLAASPMPWDGFAYEVWTPLLNGGCCTLLVGSNPLDADAVRSYLGLGVNSMFMPSPLFAVLAEEEPSLFAYLTFLAVGGERVSADAVRRIKQRYPDLFLINSYGPAENSIVTASHIVRVADLDDDSNDIPIGLPVPNTSVQIINSSGLPVADGDIGELVTTGDGVAVGYLGDPRETEKHFFESKDGKLPPGRYYRTGDLVTRDQAGLLRYRGRVDRQIKRNGLRMEPGEIEAVLEAHPLVNRCVVVPVETNSGRVDLACVYTTTDGRPLRLEVLRDSAAARLLSAMLPSAFYHAGRLPVSENGKIDLMAVRQLAMSRAAGQETTRRPVSDDDPVAGEIAALLGRKGLTADEDLLAAGMTSLDAVRIAARLSHRLGRRITAADIYRSRSISNIKRRPPRRSIATSDFILRGSGEYDGPLTGAQRRLLFTEWIAPGDMDNVIVEVYRITGPIDVAALQQAIFRVVVRHAALRTLFPVHNGEPVQRTLSPEQVASPLVIAPPQTADCPLADLAQRCAEDSWATGPFHLDREIPLRARLYRVDSELHLLSIHVHHIASDGTSEAVVVRDIMRFYADVLAGRPAPRPAVPSYADFSTWERANLATCVGEGIEHWRSALANVPPRFLPEPTQSIQVPSRTFARDVDAQTVTRLVRAASRRGGPPLSALITAAALALGRCFAVSDLCLGTLADGRLDPAFDEVVGFFVNPLAVPVRSVLRGTADLLLSQVAEQVVSALEFAMTPFDELVRLIRPAKDRHPLFQAWAILQAQRPAGELAPGTALAPLITRPTMTRREWMLQAFPQPEGGWILLVDARSDALDDALGTKIVTELENALTELAESAGQ